MKTTSPAPCAVRTPRGVARALACALLSAVLAAALVPCAALADDEGEAAAEDATTEDVTTSSDTATADDTATDEETLDEVALDASSLADADELAAGYIESVLYASIDPSLSTLASYGASYFSGTALTLYEELCDFAADVAANGGSTIYAFSFTQASSGRSGPGQSSSQLSEAVASLDVSNVFLALLADCPYEMYWFDKSTGASYSSKASYGQGTMTVTITFKFTPSEDYAGSSDYTVDASKAKATAAAAENALAIVEGYTGSDDVESILTYYKDEICSLVSYDSDADSSSYGDPWQIVYVFDGDEDTNVVCEGYAKAFQYLCDLTWPNNDPLWCYTVSGTLTGGTGAGGHMWNIVRVDDESYLVDVTNSDSGTVGRNGDLFLVGEPASGGSVSAGYTFTIRLSSKTYSVSYVYDSYTTGLYSEEILTLSSEDFPSVESPSYTLTRLGGSNRYVTAALEAVEAYGDAGCETVVLATGEDFPDSLASTSLAGALGAAVLLTAGEELSAAAEEAIAQLGASHVIVVGGEAAVGEAVLEELEAAGLAVERVAGETRYETAAAIYEYGLGAGEDGGSVWGEALVVASGVSSYDALSASSLAYAQCWPILLANADGELTDEEAALAEDADASQVFVVGGTAVVSEDAADGLAQAFGEDAVERLWGANRYATSVAVAEYAVEGGYLVWDGACFASGKNFPDALAGSALAGSLGSVLLLVSDSNTAALDALSENADAVSSLYILGGTSAVSNAVKTAITSAMGSGRCTYSVVATL